MYGRNRCSKSKGISLSGYETCLVSLVRSVPEVLWARAECIKWPECHAFLRAVFRTEEDTPFYCAFKFTEEEQGFGVPKHILDRVKLFLKERV